MWPRAQESVLRGSWGAASPLDFQVCFCPLGLVGSPAPSRLTSASSRWCVPRPRGETPRLLRCSAPGLAAATAAGLELGPRPARALVVGESPFQAPWPTFQNLSVPLSCGGQAC